MTTKSNTPINPANFEEFAGFLMFKKWLPAEQCPINISELTEEMVQLYAPEFLELQAEKTKVKQVTLPRTITHAVRCSLDNSLLMRRKSLEFTFMSDGLHEETILSALTIINQRYVGTHEYISASNPLVSILGLDKRPEFAWVEWESVLYWSELPLTMRISNKKCRHNVDEILIPDQIMKCHLQLNLYHPYIWQLITEDRLWDIKLFLTSYEYKLFVNYAANFLRKKAPNLNLS